MVLLFNLLPQKFRLYFLLIVSYAFYACIQSTYVLLLAGVTITTFLSVWGMTKAQKEWQTKSLAIGGIILTLLPLFFFKYFNAAGSTLSSLIGFSFTPVSLMLPVGISFYTFMAIGYIIDSYNEMIDEKPSLVATGLFLSFFPLVLSGPIERAGNMLPQFQNLRRSTADDLSSGAKTMLWGYFMKLCVADRLALYCTAVYAHVAQHNGTSLAVASLLYPIHAYCDLGGYTLIAIGTAQCLGMKVIPNFRRPFFATSINDFWHRWHKSLIQWLTDYIFTPLSFLLRSKGTAGICLALLITFLISGLWHGAALACIIWGLFQAVFLCIDLIVQKRRSALEQKHQLNRKWWWILPCAIITYLIVSTSLIIVNGANLSESWMILTKIFTAPGKPFIDISSLVLGIGAFTLVMAKDFLEEFKPRIQKIATSNAVCMLLIVLILLIGVFDGGSFIYFQF